MCSVYIKEVNGRSYQTIISSTNKEWAPNKYGRNHQLRHRNRQTAITERQRSRLDKETWPPKPYANIPLSYEIPGVEELEDIGLKVGISPKAARITSNYLAYNFTFPTRCRLLWDWCDSLTSLD